ncbi:vitamin B12 dependent-methionine synthase activation domain-containing protein [Carboxylicivirga sp. RSCT41]|uniref:vitamin B12 dependent-methionine synthase activation domain-containing protein n=1 Tax=Carboxylicivirga agarovorans TaxID=3417570 RepID=UPI003D3379B7
MSTIKKNTFELDELGLDISSIGRMMGYKEGVPDGISEMIENELQQLKHVNGIIGGYQLLDSTFKVQEHALTIGAHDFHVGKSVFHHLKKSDQMALFICTAGSTISERSKMLMNKGDLMEGYVVDVIGSLAVETAMDIISIRLGTLLSTRGQKCTNRYSPGYCGWDVAEQSKLFSFFPDKFCGVTLNDSCLMSPVKSVSGIMGVGKNVQFKKYTCHACGSVQCIYRGKKK